jgi:hypothetical protein
MKPPRDDVELQVLVTEFVANGRYSTAEIQFDDGKFPVRVTIDLRNDWNRFVELKHATRDQHGQGRDVTSRIRLVQTVPTFGGFRWWFLCPRTGCRTTKLFLPRGGWHFLSRQAYGLTYDSQREAGLDLLRRRAIRLSRQLGETDWDFWAPPPPKPKWMRWRTYRRKAVECETATEAARSEFIMRGKAILKKAAPEIRST